jgi:hypothetical protein
MNYYIIPKNNFKIKIFLTEMNKQTNPVVSYSLIYHLNDIYSNLTKLEDSSSNMTLDYINKIVNPFEFIHTNVPGSHISVSKVKADSNIFFELYEIFQLCDILNLYQLTKTSQLRTAHMTSNYSSTIYLFNLLREENEDINIVTEFEYNKMCEMFVTNSFSSKIDLFIFEYKDEDYTNMNQYIKNVLLTFYIIIKFQSNNGSCIIKLDNIFYKIIIDIIFILSCVYDKVYLVKPSLSNISKGERFLVCKHFNYATMMNNNLLSQLEEQIRQRLINYSDSSLIEKNIHSILYNEIPYYFLNKIEESNSIIGQQELESWDQIINIFKNKNKDEKIETLKRNHIQKCIQWCEKNQLPHNKFTDKINIFLQPKKKEEAF